MLKLDWNIQSQLLNLHLVCPLTSFTQKLLLKLLRLSESSLYPCCLQVSGRANLNLNPKTLFYKDCSLGSVKPVDQLVVAKLLMIKHNNNNNEYLERLTRTGPKRLHVLYKYILSKFNAYNMNVHTRTHTHASSFFTHIRTHAQMIKHHLDTKHKWMNDFFYMEHEERQTERTGMHAHHG